MNYKKLFFTTVTILILFILAFILIPLAFGYKIGFINSFHFSLEEPYYLLSVAVAIAVAVFTYKIYTRQLKLMEEQKTISDAQTKISKKQTEIMEQQNNIALFDKRNESLLSLIQIVQMVEILTKKERYKINIYEQMREHMLYILKTFGYCGDDDCMFYIGINDLMNKSSSLPDIFHKIENEIILDFLQKTQEFLTLVYDKEPKLFEFHETLLSYISPINKMIDCMNKQLILIKEDTSWHSPKQTTKMQ